MKKSGDEHLIQMKDNLCIIETIIFSKDYLCSKIENVISVKVCLKIISGEEK